jgi:hypothetical protein
VRLTNFGLAIGIIPMISSIDSTLTRYQNGIFALVSNPLVADQLARQHCDCRLGEHGAHLSRHLPLWRPLADTRPYPCQLLEAKSE